MRRIPAVGTVNVDILHLEPISFGDGAALVNVPKVGKGSIIWRHEGPGMQSVDYEAMGTRDAAIDAGCADRP